MPPSNKRKPANPLKTVKERIRMDDIYFDSQIGRKDPLQTAYWNFGWQEDDIKKALLKLNDKYHSDDPQYNHFYKHEPHKDFPGEDTHMDHYKAYNLMDKMDVYTHFHIREKETTVVISSLHQLN